MEYFLTTEIADFPWEVQCPFFYNAWVGCGRVQALCREQTTVRVDPIIQSVFGHFQNLNLLALLEDLRSGRAAEGTWSSSTLLCPVAHGLPVGQVVRDLQFLSQAVELERACDYAARHLGADFRCVYRFVQLWDSHAFGQGWLLRQLEDLWQERLADAEAVQAVLERPTFTSEVNGARPRLSAAKRLNWRPAEMLTGTWATLPCQEKLISDADRE